MTVELTDLQPDDVERIWPWLIEHLRWHLRTWSEALDLGWDDQAIDARMRAGRLVEGEWVQVCTAAEDDASLVRVARVDGVVVGLVVADRRHDRYLGLDLGVLSWIYVDPAHRGTGVGTALMDEATGWMAREGLRASEVFLAASNEAAVRRYRAHGYRVVDHRMFRGG